VLFRSVSLGSPVVASYPAIAMPVAMVLGSLPSWRQIAAMVATMAGVWLVAWAVARTRGDERPEYAKPVIRRALAMAIISAISMPAQCRTSIARNAVFGKSMHMTQAL